MFLEISMSKYLKKKQRLESANYQAHQCAVMLKLIAEYLLPFWFSGAMSFHCSDGGVQALL